MVLVACLLSGAFAHAAKPALSGPSLVAPIVVDGTPYNSAWIFPDEDNTKFFIEAAPLLETLQIFLPDDLVANIRAQVTATNALSVALLNTHGISASFDQRSLDLVLTIPGKFRRRGAIEVSPYAIPSYQNVVQSSFYSGYLNARVSDAFVHPHREAQKTRQPYAGNLTLVNNIGGLALEAAADYTERAAHPWRRDDSRAVVDWESKMLRFTAGDLQFPFAGYQNSVAMAGLSVTRQFSIQPYLSAKPINASEIFLQRPSTVEVYVNGIFRSRLNMPAGPVDVRDFPLDNGLNNVEVKITDDLGKTETIQLSMLFDPVLLKRGLHQYTYNVGAPSTATDRDRRYDRRNLTSSMFHRLGVLDNLTMGLNFQMDQGQRLAGLEQSWMSPIGLWGIDGAAQWNKGAKAAYAGKLSLRTPEYFRGYLLNTRLNLVSEYKDLNFGSLSDGTTLNVYSWNWEAYVRQMLPWQLSMGAGHQEDISRYADSPNRVVWKGDLSVNLAHNWRTSLNYSHSASTTREDRYFITIGWTDSVGRYYGSVNYDSFQKLKRVDMTRNAMTQMNDVRFSAGAQQTPTDKEADLQAEYVAQRGSVRLEHQYYDTATAKYHQSSLALASGLAWTDSSLAITRPISDSFVILPSKPQLKKFNIAVNNNGSTSEAETSWLGPAVLPTAVSYAFTPVSIDNTRLPVGYSVGREFWAARPRYKSGVTIWIGGDTSLIASGSLVDTAGAPLSLISGELFDQNGVSVGNNFFTNRKGQFFVENLKPGRYELRFNDPKYKTLAIALDGEVGVVQLPPLKVQRNPD